MGVNNIHKEVQSDIFELKNAIQEYNDAYVKWCVRNSEHFSPDTKKEKKFPESRKTWLIKFMEVLINDLAMQWDNRINNARKDKIEKDKTGKEDYLLESIHRFLIIDDRSISSPILEKTYRLLPPDKRLGIILCNFDWKNKRRDIMMSILHEMGHSIGKREREYRFNNVFIPMLAERIIFQWAASLCGLINDENSEKLLNAKDRTALSIGRLEDVCSLYSIQEELQKQIMGKFQAAQNAQCVLYNEYIEKVKLEEDEKTEEILKRQKTSLEKHFFISCRGLLLNELSVIFDTTKKDGTSIFDLANDILSKSVTFNNDEARNKLKECFIKMGQACEDGKMESESLPIWYRDAAEILEETVADVFMLRICSTQPSSRLYCNLLMRRLQKKAVDPKDILIDSLSNHICMPSNMLRVLGVCHAVENHSRLLKNSIRHDNNTYLEGIINGEEGHEYKLGSLFVKAFTNASWRQRTHAQYYIDNKYKHVRQYIDEENKPSILFSKYIDFCYLPNTIRNYFNYVDMIWNTYDEIFDVYASKKDFWRPINRIREEVKHLRWIGRVKYLISVHQVSSEQTNGKSVE